MGSMTAVSHCQIPTPTGNPAAIKDSRCGAVRRCSPARLGPEQDQGISAEWAADRAERRYRPDHIDHSANRPLRTPGQTSCLVLETLPGPHWREHQFTVSRKSPYNLARCISLLLLAAVPEGVPTRFIFPRHRLIESAQI